jgi:hypothetical protein
VIEGLGLREEGREGGETSERGDGGRDRDRRSEEGRGGGKGRGGGGRTGWERKEERRGKGAGVGRAQGCRNGGIEWGMEERREGVLAARAMVHILVMQESSATLTEPWQGRNCHVGTHDGYSIHVRALMDARPDRERRVECGSSELARRRQ